jgi:hypothetical protein
LLRGGEGDGIFICNTFLELAQVHRLLNDVADLVEVVFGHFGVLLNGFLYLHLLLEQLVVLVVRLPAFGRYDLQ